MMNGQPLNVKKLKILVALTLLAWATQTLFHQWGFGQELPEPDAIPAAEKFVPQSTLVTGAGTLELRSQATIYGGEIHLKQLCRWSDSEAPIFSEVANLVISRIAKDRASKLVTLEDIRSTLHDAGVNLGAIRFCGAIACKVDRSDPSNGDRDALQQWIQESQPAGTVALATSPATRPSVTLPLRIAREDNEGGVRTLREQLLTDLSQRLNLPVDQLEVNFDSKDASLLSLSEPNFHFEIRAKRMRDLGEVSWGVTILTVGGQQQVSVTAQARAWENQLVVTRPVTYREVLRDEDVAERRVLIERLPDAVVLDKTQVVGQQASQDLQPGTIMTARLVQSVPLAKTGQYVTVTLNQGSVQIKTVAVAMEPGSFGQSIKVKNESTRDVFEVTLTGPQTATMGGAGDAGLAMNRN